MLSLFVVRKKVHGRAACAGISVHGRSMPARSRIVPIAMAMYLEGQPHEQAEASVLRSGVSTSSCAVGRGLSARGSQCRMWHGRFIQSSIEGFSIAVSLMSRDVVPLRCSGDCCWLAASGRLWEAMADPRAMCSATRNHSCEVDIPG